MAKYKGSTPLVIGKNLDGLTTQLSCPRPLSRKKLRSLMWRNRPSLSSEALSTNYSRIPGLGRARNRMMRQLDELKLKSQRVGGVDNLDYVSGKMYAILSLMFGTRAQRTARNQ